MLYIKDEDEEAFAELFRVQLASTKHFSEFRCLHVDNPKNRLRMGQRRARELADASYLRRLELPEYRRERRGPEPFVYALGPKAARHIARRLGVDERDIAKQLHPSSDRKLLASPSHSLQITDYYLALKRACEETNFALLSWKNGAELHRHPLKVTITNEKGNPEKATLRPDFYHELEVRSEEGWYTARIFGEHDRNTEPIRSRRRRTSWRRKFRCYVSLAESGQLAETCGIKNLWVTIVTTAGKGRVASIKAEAEEIAGKDNHSFWITTFDKIKAVRPSKDDPPALNILTEPIWTVSGQDGLHRMTIV